MERHKIIDNACIVAYTVGMSSNQYTIRSIPPKLDAALRRRAQKSGKSLNEVLVETLAIGAGVSPDTNFNDLDWFIGNKSLDKSFSQAIDWLDAAPKEIQ
jgi:hypothetical protein